jgi:3-dehydroquinate synthase
MFRGLDWIFYPTTLLAQADSCIGSKSSINVGEIKNLLGTFTPPRQVRVDPLVLETLGRDEIRSGVGEMLKVHIIDGPQSFESIEKSFDRIFSDREVLLEFVYRSLLIKKRIIELDEFDQGIRNVMNYGHSFGHAIESATDFAIPHGIAVTIGMDMANYVAAEFGLISSEHAGYFKRVHGILRKNYAGYEGFKIPFDRFINGISKDKKNTASKLGLILPGKDALPARSFQTNDERFQATCRRYFEGQTGSV